MMFKVLLSFHLVAVIAWMSGLLYLPRLFVYHTAAQVGSEMDETFKTMETKILKIIMNPSMLAVVALGAALAWYDGARRLGWAFLLTSWMLVKLAGALILIGWHCYLSVARKDFSAGRRVRSARFWRVTNEAPFIVAIVMILAVVTKFGG